MADSPYQEGQFCWYEIATRDAEQAKTFYAALLGYDMEDSPMPGGGTYTTARTEEGDALGLYEMGGPDFEGVPPHWAPYVWVNDVDATCAKAKTLGGTVLAEPMELEGVGRFAFLSDPTGARLGVFQGMGHMGAAHGFSKGLVGWNELTTGDVAAAEAFYTSLFGWTAATAPMPEGDGSYTTFSVGEQGAAGMMAMEGPAWEGVPPNWMSYVNVEDCQAVADRAVELGGEVHVPPHEVPTIGTFSVLQDPGGAAFSVMSWSVDMG